MKNAELLYLEHQLVSFIEAGTLTVRNQAGKEFTLPFRQPSHLRPDSFEISAQSSGSRKRLRLAGSCQRYMRDCSVDR
jgi:hypothetical protein